MTKHRSSWYGDEFKDKAEQKAIKNLTKVAIEAHNDLKKELAKEKSPPVSKPGEVPHLMHGELARSVAFEVDKNRMISRVGTNKKYGLYLELGTSKMAKRPWLLPTMRKNLRKYKNMLGDK